jgi:hypothetical protein
MLRSITGLSTRVALLSAFALLCACGGGGGSSPGAGTVPVPPGPVSIAPNGTLFAQGAHGSGFTFIFGAAVPAGEVATVTPGVPAGAPYPLDFYKDAVTIVVGPQPLPASAFVGVTLTNLPFTYGAPGGDVFETDVSDVADKNLELALPTAPQAWNALPVYLPTGTLTALQPGHVYEAGLFFGAAQVIGVGF